MGEQIKRLRRLKGWTQHDLAEYSGVDRTTIGQVEAGNRDASAGTVRKLAAALGVPVSELFKEPIDRFTVAFQQIEDGWWFARCMEVPEAFTQGETLGKARENIRDAIELILEDRREEAEKDLEGLEGVIREPLAL